MKRSCGLAGLSDLHDVHDLHDKWGQLIFSIVLSSVAAQE